MPTFQVEGTRLEYIEQGEGEPVVLVHGTLGDYRSWQLQMDVYSESYRTVSYSRRYHYPNECRGDESDYSAALHADDLAGLIAGLGLDSAHVVGNSYGAYTALLLAARHPQRARSVVLGDPPVFPLLDHIPKGRTVRDDFLARVWERAGDLMRQGETRAGVRTFVDGVVEEGTFDGFPPEIQDLIMENACEFGVETSSPAFWTAFTCGDAATIETPTLLLTGDGSLEMFQLIVDELDRCMPNSEVRRVPDTTHEVSSDNPEAYNEMVLEFLAGQTS